MMLNRRLMIATMAALASPTARSSEPRRRDWPRGHASPSLVLSGLDGTPWSLAETSGDAVLLNFWASWCEPCRAEMPSLAALAQRTNGLRVVAVNYRESLDDIRRFVETTALALPVVRDPAGTAAKGFDVHAFPSTVAIDRRGRTRFIVMGECDWGDAQSGRWVRELLAERA
jgi:thiol-disulfide isomerase/thioredoxin